MDLTEFFSGREEDRRGRTDGKVRSEVIRSPFYDFDLMDGQYGVVLVLVRGETLIPSKTAPFW
jgi:hypothetical protein